MVPISPLVNDPYETLRPYVPGKPVSETERELGITGAVKLASNENPLGPSPKALAAVRDTLARGSDYPDGGAFYLKQGLAEFTGFPSSQVVVGNGTNELIEMAVRTFVRPGEHMLFARHSFVIYKLCAMAAGVPIKEVPFREDHIDLSALAEAVTPETKLVFVDNPNNPTGTHVGRKDVEAFLEKVPPQVVIVLDEAYFEYHTAEDYPHGFDYIGQRERLIVTRTFSKAYGLAGFRVGYGIAEPSIIDYLNRARQPFNVNALAQVAALAALKDTEHVEKTVTLNHREMERMIPEFTNRGLGVLPSQANFVLVDFHRDSQEVFNTLLRQGVIVRPMEGYGFPTRARITIGTPEHNNRLLHAIDAVL